jgi:HK97 gp10 family phage protein
MARIEVKGLAELGARLDLLSVSMQVKIAGQATGAAARVVKRRAVQLAPVAPEPYVVLGDLIQPENIGRNIVAKKIRLTEHTAEHIVTVRGKKKYGYASRIGSLQEFGTVKQAAQPFLRPAFDQEIGAAITAMKKALVRGIERAAKGGR